MQRFHPIFRMIVIFATLLFTMFLSSLTAAIISFSAAAVTVFLLAPSINAFKRIALSLLAAAAIALTNPIFSHRGATPLFFLNDKPYTFEALIYGANFGISLCAALLWFSVLNRLCSRSDYICVFSGFSPKLALIISMIMGYIPRIRHKLSDISDAQKASGIYLTDSHIDRLRFSSRVFFAVTAWSAESCAETSLSMKARSYGYFKRSNAAKHSLKSFDFCYIFAALAVCITVIFSYAAAKQQWQFYPTVLTPKQSPCSCVFVISFATLCFTAPIILLKEKIKWKLLVSKI